MTRDEAIQHIQYVRDTHVDWVRLFAYCGEQTEPWDCARESVKTRQMSEPLRHEGGGLVDCATCLRLAATAGDSDHHQVSVDNYDGVLAVLRSAPA